MKKLPPELAEKLLKASAGMPKGSGFDVSIDEVAHLSGVPRATLYYYFSGKDDLVQFYLNDLMERTRVAIQKAAATEGSHEDRLAAVMAGIIGAFAEYPKMCMELPAAIKHASDYSETMAKMDQAVMAPLREVLIEGKTGDELTYSDVDTAANAIMGALHMVSMTRLIRTGHLDADETSAAVVPQLISGLLPR